MFKLNKFWLTPVLIGMISSVLTGCGTKGPLYIPEQRYPQQAYKQMHKPSLAQVRQSAVIQKPIVINSN